MLDRNMYDAETETRRSNNVSRRSVETFKLWLYNLCAGDPYIGTLL